MMSIKNKKVQLAAGCVFAILLAGYFVFFYKSPLAQVGDWKIYKEDAELRDRVILLNFPNEKRSMGLFQLMKSAIHLQILKNNGVSIGSAQIEKEEERINQSTKNPEQLAQVKAIFGKNVEAYRRDFILPALVDHMIYYDFFLKDEKVQTESLQKTMELIQQAQGKNMNLKKLAADRNLEVRKLTVDLIKGLKWEERNATEKPEKTEPRSQPKETQVQMQQENQELYNRIQEEFNRKKAQGKYDEEALKWQEGVIAPLKVGEVTATPISRDQVWLVAKLSKKISNEVFELEVVAIPKLDYGQWYEQEKAKVKISVQDKNYPIP